MISIHEVGFEYGYGDAEMCFCCHTAGQKKFLESLSWNIIFGTSAVQCFYG